MRRLALVASLLLLAVSPASASRADCTVTVAPAVGAAPLAVTFTATCASSAYTWSFGDGQQATGASVTHTYAAGLWQPTLATDAGTQSVQAVTSVAVALTGPKQARYAHWVTLRASVTPRLPVEVRGRRVTGGTIRFRALTTAPFVAFADGVRSAPLSVKLIPKLVVRAPRVAAVGARVRVVATLHPAHAGTVHVAQVDTRTPHVARVVVTVTPARGWVAVSETARVTVAQPHDLHTLRAELGAQHYLLPPSSDLTDSIYAFQKVNGLPRTGVADAATWRALGHPIAAHARYAQPVFHIEVNKPLQVLYVVRGGKVAQIVPVSTAGLPGKFTPVGRFAVYRKVTGFDPSPLGTLYDPSYFTGGYAIHGNPSVPPYPASHGCVRVPMWAAPVLYDEMPYGTVVYVY